MGGLLRREQITLRDRWIRRRWPTASEFAEHLSDPRQQEVLRSRLRGEPLEEIGQRLGVVRERGRQLMQKALARRPRLYEDQYQYLFNHYDISLEEFQLAFDEPEEIYHYLEMVRPKGERMPLRELLADEAVPVPLRRLRSAGADAGDLADYGAAVCAFTLPGEYFTVASLRREGFAHPLDDLGFDEWFYGSLLAEDPERFTYRRMGGTRLFCRGRKTVQLADFPRWLVEAEPSGRIDVYELQETLERQYGISIPSYKLIEAAQGSELYYDAIMKAVYLNYDTYLEEI